MPQHSPSGVPVSEAAMQFFVEAIKANTTVLEMVGKSMVGIQEEQKAQLKLINDVRERVIRIEAVPSLGREVAELRGEFKGLFAKVQILETTQAADHAADIARSSLWEGIVRYGPSVAVFLFTIVGAIFIVLALTGRLQPISQSQAVPVQYEAESQPREQPANPRQ